MARKASPRLVGVFVIAAIMLASTGVVLFGSGRVFKDTHEFIVFFRGSVGGLNPGAPVKFKGVEVGAVKSVRLSIGDPSIQGDEFRMPVIIELDQRKITRRGAGGIDIADPETHRLWLEQGMRAKLTTESFVTGRKYVELDILPDTPADMVNDPTVPYPELPIVAGGLEELEVEAGQILANLARLDFDTLVSAVTAAFVSIDRLVSSDDLGRARGALPSAIVTIEETLEDFGNLAKNLDSALADLRVGITSDVQEARATMQETQETLAALRAVLEPGSPVTTRLEQALIELAAAGKAMRELAEYLQRDPSSVLRGKEERKENR
ncbi:MAG: MCE family protein [Gemmatimonadota bacterium]|nr:MAG: MCE family protein [Gemmatimonadota bacterium]